ncbi:MAG: NAD(+)/NADH kinase [Spirochaetes bacterium]|jgi:NAD+ kinase|nr:NAD(+)/NADH kinase [Spirochaetota bacterium]
MIKRVSINFRPNDDDIKKLLVKVVDFLKSKNVEVLLPESDYSGEDVLGRCAAANEDFIGTPDLVVVIGGDGTFLRTARMFVDAGRPIFGINRGRLGFLTEFNPEECFKYLGETINGNYTSADRNVMEVARVRNRRTVERMYFINDSVISKGAFSRAIGIELEINGSHFTTYNGDGLIISTPTGSTAYSLSAGGPIIVPSAADIYLITPICPHTLANRPIVIQSDSVLKARIVSDAKNLLLTIDGQEAIQIDGDDEIIFSQTDKKIKLITHPEKNFYEILREKLGWG